MSWNVSGAATKQDAVEQIANLEPINELGEGEKFQLLKAKEYALEAIASGAVKGESFSVSLTGHSNSDSPESAGDSINIAIYATSWA